MPEINEAKIGHFCWFELGTTDQEAAKRYYGNLFGWSARDFPMGPDGVYTMFLLNDRDVAACYTLRPDQQAHGVPPHWMTYISVSSADEATEKARSLGATVIMPAFDVFDVGRMAVLQDPTSAVFCVWQAGRHCGVRLWGELNTVCWCELLTRDVAAAKEFYTKLFGWGTKVSTGAGFPYTHWQLEGQDIGGMMQINEQMGPVPPHWLNYVRVANCDETVAKATAGGGKALCPPMDIPNTGRFSVLQDPQGAALAVIALAPMHK